MKTKLTILLWVAHVAAIGTVKAAVVSGPIVNPNNGHSYYLLSQNNWSGSEAEAVALGGHLVTINDAAENQWVFNTFSSFGGANRYLWLGLHDVGSSSKFNWVWTWGEPFTYANWSPVEPNLRNEHFTYMYPNGAPADGYQRNPGTWNNYLDLSTEFTNTPLLGVAEIVPAPPTACSRRRGLPIVRLIFRRCRSR